MKILFINPAGRRLLKTHCFPPIGLLSLATAVKARGHTPEIIDVYANNYTNEEILKKIKVFAPHFICITLSSLNLFWVNELTKLIKRNFPNLKIILGGPHVNAVEEEVLHQFRFVDFAFYGESEFSLPEFLDNPNNPKRINGLIYRVKSKVLKNPPSEEIQNLDQLPLPDIDLLKNEYLTNKYFSILTSQKPVGVILTSRGCPYRCGFCYYKFQSYRTRSPESVINEIKYQYSKGIRHIEILDDNFLLDKNRAIQIFKMIQKARLNLTLRIKSRVDAIDDEILREGKKANLEMVSFGCESGSERILKKMKKGITLKQIEKACRLTKRYRIICFTSWIFGYLGETREDIRRTVSFIKKIKPSAFQISPLYPYPKTEVYRSAKANKQLVGDWDANSPKIPWVKLPWMSSYGTLLKEVKRAKLELYTRPFYFKFFLELLFKYRNPLLVRYGIQYLRSAI